MQENDSSAELKALKTEHAQLTEAQTKISELEKLMESLAGCGFSDSDFEESDGEFDHLDAPVLDVREKSAKGEELGSPVKEKKETTAAVKAFEAGTKGEMPAAAALK